MLSLIFLAIVILLLIIIVVIIETQSRKVYKPVICTTLDVIAIDQSIMVLHMYAQIIRNMTINFERKTVEAWIFVHYPKPKELTQDWHFHPIYGEVGPKDWGGFLYDESSMIGFVAVNHPKKLITIAFRNSRSIGDWYHNFDLSFEQNDLFTYPGPLHVGYTKIFISYYKQFEKCLNEILEQNPDMHTYDILLTGHSLGGALAVLTTIYLIDHPKYKQYFGFNNIKLVTFGAPYVGTKNATHDFSTWMRAHVGYIKCFERSTDMAPLLPKYLNIQLQKAQNQEIVEPIAPAKPHSLFHYHASRFNFYGGHCITRYREAIYRELKLICEPIYSHFF